MNTWYYEKKDQRHGPVSADTIGALVEQRALDGQTLVWSLDSKDWISLAQTELAVYLKAVNVPPALPTSRIGKALVWFLAFAPVIGMMLEVMLGGAFAPDSSLAGDAGELAVKTGQFWYVTLVLNIGLSLLDNWRLKRAGVDTSRFGRLALVVPVYLWKRAKSLNQRPAYFWTWVVMFAITLLASV